VLDKKAERVSESERENKYQAETIRMFRKTFGPRFLEVQHQLRSKEISKQNPVRSIDVIYVKCL